MSEDAIAFDSLLDLCQNQHRRNVLKTLTEEQRLLTLYELTKVVFNYNYQTPLTEASGDVLTEIRLSLYHVHLPKLASEGLIKYKPEHQLVKPTEKLDRAQQTLSTIFEADSTLKAPSGL